MCPFVSRRPCFLRSAVLVAMFVAMAVAAPMPVSAGPTPAVEELAIRQFALEHVSLPQAMTMLRSILDIRRLSPNPAGDALVVRDTPAKVEAAARLVEMFDRPAAEVEVAVDRLLIPASAFGELVHEAGDGSQARVPTDRLAGLAVGAIHRVTTLRAVSGGSARYNATGARVPSPGAADLDLSVEPRVHSRSGEISLGISAETGDRNEAGAVIGVRRLTSSLRLGGGSTYLLIGLLPDDERDSREVAVIALTPRIIRASGLRPADLETLYSGALPAAGTTASPSELPPAGAGPAVSAP